MSELLQPAAACIPLFPTDNGFEVAIVQRASTMRFMPNAFAFPGGKVDEQDRTVPDLAEYYAATRELSEETGLSAAHDHLIPWSRWITPTYETRRFTAQFFIAPFQEHIAITVDGSETVGYRTASPQALLAEARASTKLLLPPPVLVTLHELARFSSIEAVEEYARHCERHLTRAERTFLPWRETHDDGDRLYVTANQYLRREHDRWVL